ncbi:MAG: hypothetical protein H0U13_06280 [Gemmatimonadaceae bacterium]|nr:hypothetical protein [Gemmatimonadaceae bacterium]
MFGAAGAKSPHEAFFYYSGNRLNAVRSGPWKLKFQTTLQEETEYGKIDNPKTAIEPKRSRRAEIRPEGPPGGLRVTDRIGPASAPVPGRRTDRRGWRKRSISRRGRRSAVVKRQSPEVEQGRATDLFGIGCGNIVH